MNAALKELLARVEDWPEDRQADLLAVLKEFVRQHSDPMPPLTADDLAALERSAEDMRLGRYATDAEMEALFDRYRTI
ncbi:MAG: hypothetical protein KIS96_10045 [Bauldia sp.]|nr:hypothetical protein [Bauldia sp.]